ncbi:MULTISPECIES: PE family protein [unclassified Mycobacterium]|uniref:PE family protein n=1 Tax=unclassified Mycobacterium TaxID=2642494 RepID=UPI000FBB1C1D|nr:MULTISPECIES: PE family protein [unclassified Mycobacterium]MDP7705545.1 PE family protein [Mycobacterium sp. TY815]MDP7724991.1 PE family protein [Mycobacterium sp. TY814]RUP01684.1 MAG: PE family protein [Mycobacterium sp.]
MSFMHADPEALKAAASSIAGIGSEISSANAAASLPTTGVVAAAADQVSAQVAALFSSHAQGYQQLSSQISAFHEKFVQALGTSAASYANAESSAAQTLANAVNAPAQQLLGHPLTGPAAPSLAAAAARAATQVQGVLQGVGAGNLLGALGLTPTGGIGSVAATSALLGPMAAQAAPAAVIPVSWATAIENFYNFVEPYVAYGFNLASYLVGWLPYVGILAPQINFFYYLFEPMVQAALFNSLDWLSGTISFSQGLANFWSVTSASINQFINTEIYWFLSFFPPLPPFPPLP